MRNSKELRIKKVGKLMNLKVALTSPIAREDEKKDGL